MVCEIKSDDKLLGFLVLQKVLRLIELPGFLIMLNMLSDSMKQGDGRKLNDDKL